MPTVVQISDCHLFADPQGEVRGVRTRDTFLRVWRHVREHYPNADRLIISGDLTHDERLETYRTLEGIVADVQPRLSIIVIARCPQLKLICSGHVHQEFASRLNSIPVLTTPSTGLQFRPRTRSLEVDAVAPGYRALQLRERGVWTSEVIRVPAQ